MKEKLTNTEVALKQAEMYYDAYKQNIEKYIEMNKTYKMIDIR